MAASDGDLLAALEQRYRGDRSGACIAAAVLENGTTTKAYFCADANIGRTLDDHTAFEIGSITKTMTAALLAELIGQGEIALDDAITKLLPPGAIVPTFNGAEITVGNILTHTSGLPSFPWRNTDMANPYARLTEANLRGMLAKTPLKRAPGSQYEYSNFAFMVLSYALARRSGKDFETLLHERLLSPLGMDETYIVIRPPTVRVAEGHLSNGARTSPWDVRADLGGAGGVRATLPDMVRYLEGQLGTRESPITPALARTHGSASGTATQSRPMAWETISTEDGRTFVMHPGGTGGYSAFLAFDRSAQRGAILLSDTSLTEVGGLRRLAMHLLDPSLPVGVPRTKTKVDTALIDAVVGRYRLPFGLELELRRKANGLTIQADGQPEFEMEYDSAGEFYPLAFDAVLQPRRMFDGTYTFTWYQLGGIQKAERVGIGAQIAAVAVPPQPTEAQLKEYEGDYSFSRTHGLHVSVAGQKLIARGAGPAPLEGSPFGKDTFVTEPLGAEIAFERDASGNVIALTLTTRGQPMRGTRY
jgi:serine-type D-Ala-D-Ala carboxypeptidase/endopeptidase